MNDQRETKRKAKEYALEKIGGIIILFNIIIGFLFIALITIKGISNNNLLQLIPESKLETDSNNDDTVKEKQDLPSDDKHDVEDTDQITDDYNEDISDMATDNYTDDSDEVYSDQEEYTDYDEEQNEYVMPYSDEYAYSLEDIEGATQELCKLARNEIYARHGRIFDDPDLQAYFESTSWYEGYLTADEFDDSVLNDIERSNIDVIVQYEKEQGWR